MDTLSAIGLNSAAQRRGARARVFDWNEAARRIVATGVTEAAAGLGQDWEYTGGDILLNGNPVPREVTYTYLMSNWAVPELDLDGAVEPCWIYEDESPGWDDSTYWPESALAILNGTDA